MGIAPPDRDSSCPLCGDVPDPDCFGATQEPFVWCDMVQRYICTFCAVELAIEFYQEESRYFDAAARLLGVDVWQCRMRYLEGLLLRMEDSLAAAGPGREGEALARQCHVLRQHHGALGRFIALQRRVLTGRELCAAWRELWQALAEPAFGVEVAVPACRVIIDE